MNITRSSWFGATILALLLGVAVAVGSFLGAFRHRTEIGYTYGACYAGYYEQAVADDHYSLLAGVIFGSLGWGYTMQQAVWRDAYNYNNGYLTRLYTGYSSSEGPCGIWQLVMPPYHNLRIHGNPNGFRLTPH